MATWHPQPDRSVRTAWVADAAAMAAIQHEALGQTYRALLTDSAQDELDHQEALSVLTQAWAGALRRPPTARHRVLVALEGNLVAGFAVLEPSLDPDAEHSDTELSLLHVGVGQTGRGHGSRLLSAAADTARLDGAHRLCTWVVSADHAMLGFLRSAGWEADGAERTLATEDTSATRLRQVRAHTSLRVMEREPT